MNINLKYKSCLYLIFPLINALHILVYYRNFYLTKIFLMAEQSGAMNKDKN